MEQEYKWKLADPQAGEGLLAAGLDRASSGARETISMAATYYDTADRLLWSLHGGLRLRQENGVSVCCLKLEVREEGGCTLREEFEAQAEDIRQGVALLPAQGAPEALCRQLLDRGLVELCTVDYTRRACLLRVEEDGRCCEAELTLDLGSARRQGRSGAICESEFEYKSGDPALFHAFAHRLEADYGLEPEPSSKLARAMAL